MAMCCTSLSFSLGPETVQKELKSGYPSAKAFTDMATASVNAIKYVSGNNRSKSADWVIDTIHRFCT